MDRALQSRPLMRYPHVILQAPSPNRHMLIAQLAEHLALKHVDKASIK
jgi:hypothetical protein